jgi:hypothetical protein
MMKYRCDVVVILLAVLLVWRDACARAADGPIYLASRDTGLTSAQPSQFGPSQAATNFPTQANGPAPIGQQPQYSYVPPQAQWSPAIVANDAGRVQPPQYSASNQSWSMPAPLPSVEPSGNQAAPIAQMPQPLSGDGVFLLPPTETEAIGLGNPIHSPTTFQTPEGKVRGRLLQRGYPLVNCYVVMVNMHKDDPTDPLSIGHEPLTTTTDEEGFYRFDHVPPGEYKITWLPIGTKQWIRRIALRPDAVVHEGEDVTVKDVRMALQTIN